MSLQRVWDFLLKPTHVFACCNQLQVASNHKPLRSAESIKLESFYATRRNPRLSTSSYLSSSFYNLGARRNPKCVMVGMGPNLG